MIAGLAMVAMIVPSSAQAVTAAELQAQINALLETLAGLQAQLGDLTGEPTGGTIAGCTITSFTRNLKVGMSGDDVKCLQIVLNSASDTQLSAGVGSSGQETSYFGPKTKTAVIKFQEKYTSEVLASFGLTAGTGYVGTTTRAKLNSMLAGGVVPPAGVVCGNGTCETGETSTNCPADCPVVPTAAAGLTVSLASDTPASTSIADAANMNFTKIRLTAGSEGDVKISKIYVTRTGLSANSDVLNIKIVDAETGEYKGSIGSLNVDNRAMVSIIPSLVIPAGTTKTYFIKAAILSGATAGKTVKLGIAAASDIVSDASEVTGAPVTGNAMTVVTLAIGTVTVSEIGSTVDSQPDVGDTDVIVLNWKAAAGSVEPVTVETVTVKRTGTADASDTINIELYDVSDGKSLGTVAEWSADDKATWSDLGIVIGKGETHRFKIMLDVVGGVSETAQDVNVDMVDGSDCLVSVKGNTYGFYIAPTSAVTDWGAGTTARRGQGAADQTIQAGALVVSKSASTPATGNIAAGDDIVLGVFDFEAKGENVKITALGLDFTLTSGGPMTYDQITNVSLYDEDGDIVAGPKDASEGIADRGGASAHGYLDYSDTFIVPVGIHKYTVKAKIADAVSTNDTIVVSLDRPTTSITGTGMTSNDNIVPTPAADVSGNTLTVAAIDLNVETLAYPTGRSVAQGVSDFVWATFALDAATSGEDVNVTAIIVTDTVGTGTVTDMNNAELWADLTSANSARGDVYETRVSNTEQWAVAALSFTLTQTITVAKGTFTKIALVADVDSSATGTHVFSIEDAGVTGSGASTGSALDDDAVTTNEQTMTITTYGVVTVSQDSSAPTADIVIGGKESTLNVFRLAASNVEDMDLDSITLYVTGGNTVDTYYFYNGATLLGTRPGGTAPRLDVVDGTVTVPANGNVKITVKAKMLEIVTGTVDNNTDVGAAINAAGVVDLTGLASGQAITSSETSVPGVAHQLYKSRPYVTVASTSPSGTLIPSTQALLAIFNVTAEDTEDITFESTSDTFVVEISNSLTASASDGSNGNWYIKDGEGNTLDTVSVADAATNVPFLFATKTFTVPAGETKQLKVYGDTHEYTTTGNSIQLWLDDSDDDHCIFGIDGTQNYSEGAIIFKGDMYAGAFTKPGS